jgi:hypothetical protein
VSVGSVREVIDALDERIAELLGLPPEVVRALLDRGIQATVPERDGVYYGQVFHADPHLVVLRTGPESATVHHLAEPGMPVPRGDYLEPRKKGRVHEFSRERGKRWKWLELDRDEALEVLRLAGISVRPAGGPISFEIPRTYAAAYEGALVGATSHHVLQRVGPGRFVAHCRKDFGLRSLPIGERIAITYQLGRVGLAQAPEHAP